MLAYFFQYQNFQIIGGNKHIIGGVYPPDLVHLPVWPKTYFR